MRSLSQSLQYCPEVAIRVRQSKKICLINLFKKDYDNFHTRPSGRKLKVAELPAKGIGVLDISKQLLQLMGTISTYQIRFLKKLKVNNTVELAEKIRIIKFDQKMRLSWPDVVLVPFQPH